MVYAFTLFSWLIPSLSIHAFLCFLAQEFILLMRTLLPATASTAPLASSLLFCFLHRESIHTERDSSVHASLLFRCHSCCSSYRRSCNLCRRHIAATTPFTFTLQVSFLFLNILISIIIWFTIIYIDN